MHLAPLNEDSSAVAGEHKRTDIKLTSPQTDDEIAGENGGSRTDNRAAAVAPESSLGDSPAPPPPAVEVVTGEDEGINTDDRAKGDWESKYPEEARKYIIADAIIVGTIFVLTLLALLITWRGTLFNWLAYDCPSCSPTAFNRYAYFFLGGVLGGTLYGIKYLYKVVARARWTVDRRLWRIFSPCISGGLAIAIAALTDSGVLGLTTKASSGSSYFSLGFIAGYFADSALAKMQEIAETVFGATDRHKHQQQK